MSAQVFTRKQLLERYVQAAWVLKLRLLSARRHLWGETRSLIHIETALLQMRKACESVGYMCVIAAEVEFECTLAKHRKNYKVRDTIKALRSGNQLRFPRYARLSEGDTIDGKTHWTLEVHEVEDDDYRRVVRIHERSGDLLHEKSPYLEWPASDVASQEILPPLFNSVRVDHKWLWNRFWQHSISFGDGIFFINFGQDTNCSQPLVIKQDTLIVEDLRVSFDPEFVADFRGELDWNLEIP